MKIGDRVLVPQGEYAVVTSLDGAAMACVRFSGGVYATYAARDLVIANATVPGAASTTKPAKYDADKRRWDMLLADCDKSVDEVMKVLEFGLTKYGEGTTWKTVDPKRYKRAALRHLIASLRGATTNSEDGGVQHLAQAITGLLFALQNELDPSQQVNK